MLNKIINLIAASLMVPSIGWAEKYPDCIKDHVVKKGEKFSIYVDTPMVKKNELPQLLSKVGEQTSFRPNYPEFGTDGTMWIDIEVVDRVANPIFDPKELDRLVKSELAKVAQLPVKINCK